VGVVSGLTAEDDMAYVSELFFFNDEAGFH
jgi:hypothetical protein